MGQLATRSAAASICRPTGCSSNPCQHEPGRRPLGRAPLPLRTAGETVRGAGWEEVITVVYSAMARPATMACATGEGSEPSSTNPAGALTAGWAIIRGPAPRCGQVAVCTMNG
jgi:hypothetical protein